MNVTRDHGTITVRGSSLSVDATHRDKPAVRHGWHIVIDDDCHGHGTQVRLHLYGRERLTELRELLEAIEREMGEEV